MRALPFLALLVLMGCQSAPSVTGTWHIQQEGNALGEGADKIDWEFKDDKSFTIKAGPMTVLAGNYTFDGSTLTLSGGSTEFGTTYRLVSGKLVPVVNGQEVKTWRLMR